MRTFLFLAQDHAACESIVTVTAGNALAVLSCSENARRGACVQLGKQNKH